MSRYDAESERQIPTGILVSSSSLVCRPERPTPRCNIDRPRRLPLWFSLVAGVLTVCVIAAGFSLNSMGHKEQAVAVRKIAVTVQTTEVPSPANWRAESGKKNPVCAVKAPPSELDELAANHDGDSPRFAPKLPMQGVRVADDIVWPKIRINAPPAEPEKVESSECEVPQFQPAASFRQADPKECAEVASNRAGVRFVKSPPEAFKKARSENKLVFMMHLSGNWEDSGFT